MSWSWTSQDRAHWRHLRHKVANALDQEERGGRPSKGMLAELNRAIARATKARFPTNDAREVADLRAFLQLADGWAQAGGGALTPALGRALEKTALVVGRLNPRAAAPSKHVAHGRPPGYRAPYADD